MITNVYPRKRSHKALHPKLKFEEWEMLLIMLNTMVLTSSFLADKILTYDNKK